MFCLQLALGFHCHLKVSVWPVRSLPSYLSLVSLSAGLNLSHLNGQMLPYMSNLFVTVKPHNYFHSPLKLSSEDSQESLVWGLLMCICILFHLLLRFPFLACGGLISPSLRRAGKLN